MRDAVNGNQGVLEVLWKAGASAPPRESASLGNQGIAPLLGFHRNPNLKVTAWLNNSRKNYYSINKKVS